MLRILEGSLLVEFPGNRERPPNKRSLFDDVRRTFIREVLLLDMVKLCVMSFVRLSDSTQ